MDWTQASKKKFKIRKNEQGVALFMVMSVLSILAVLISEITYQAQLNHKLSYDAVDQVKAHYLAKSGMKLSLLRLKVFQQIQGFLSGNQNGSLKKLIPQRALNMIWSFPLSFPLPTNLPGMTGLQKDAITDFNNNSGFEGAFSAYISSESSKFNLNSSLSRYAPEIKKEKPKPNQNRTSTSTSGSSQPTNPNKPNNQKENNTQFNAELARKSLRDYITRLLNQKFLDDENFSARYRDFRVEDLVENILGWIDRSYESKSSERQDDPPMKKAPFYHLSELHMIRPMDDDLYDFLKPHFTVAVTPGVNVNQINKEELMALVPQMTKEEADDFFDFRDKPDEDNLFKDEKGFFDYLSKNVIAFVGAPDTFKEFQKELKESGIQIITDETQFKVEVQAQVNQATRTIEAWVDLGGKTLMTPKAGQTSPSTASTKTNNASLPVLTKGIPPSKPDPGMVIRFMRIY
ncbi:MAG: hypothetical protein CL678_05040 [Bdellovibrionaceae bacterium]|nr:hypothetical protein [Pseudobdellovibrionaceae bacterium]|tara:strand:- start:229 stop:1608 length:1380 start_codon:yes stop_codon:yes gene_type:complete